MTQSNVANMVSLLEDYLESLYPQNGKEVGRQILELLGELRPGSRRELDHKDALLISYPNQINSLEPKDSEASPLMKLSNFYAEHLRTCFSGIHLLPFYPATSDGGFAVSDYNIVDPKNGDWTDITNFGCDLMFDGVFNHTSSKHAWFQSWLEGDKEFENFYHHFKELPEEGSEDRKNLDQVSRPRSSDLLAPFDSKNGKVYAWATFGPDQLDVDFSNPRVLLEFVKILLLYTEKGANYIRIDAVPFLWKELGTNCLHHEKTHVLVKVLRTILDLKHPEVLLITESNVPHKENISYLGNGRDEAQLVYNFSLAPLIMYSLLEQNTEKLKSWVSNLEPLPEENTFFNFTATHDGIGVRPLEGILSEEEIGNFVGKLRDKGALLTERSFGNTKKPYEVNITWSSALDEDVDKFMTSQAMSLVFPGIPGVYFHNLLATPNWIEGFETTQHKRDINRRSFGLEELNNLIEKDRFHSEVFQKMTELLEIRRSHPAFHPNASFEQIDAPNEVWAIRRKWQDEQVTCLFNVTDQVQRFEEKELSPFSFDWSFTNLS